MKPDRILLAELRAEEAFDYLRNVNSGHPGSITSVHAASAALAFEQLVLLIKQSRAGAELARADIKSLLYQLVDVVIQFGRDGRERVISEVWYEPARKAKRRASRRSAAARSRSVALSVGAIVVILYLAGYFFLWSAHLPPSSARPPLRFGATRITTVTAPSVASICSCRSGSPPSW